MKTGILATLWLIVQEKNGVELQPFPELRMHKQGDCSGIQNAVDFYLDHFVSNFSLCKDHTNIINAKVPQSICYVFTAKPQHLFH